MRSILSLEKKKKKNPSKTRMIGSILKQDPNTRKVKKNAIYEDKTQRANIWGNPPYPATKQHLHNS